MNAFLCILSTAALLFTPTLLFSLSYSLGAFFSSAKVLFLLYPLQSSEYLCMNISLRTQSMYILLCIISLTNRVSALQIKTFKCKTHCGYDTRVHRELVVYLQRRDQNDPDRNIESPVALRGVLPICHSLSLHLLLLCFSLTKLMV